MRVAAVGCVALALAAPAAARAGTYEVAICHDPGTALSAPTDGVTFLTAGADADAGIYQSCAGGGYVYAALDGLAAHGPSDLAAWRFTAPPGTQIAATALWRAFYAGTSIPFASPLDTINLIASDGTVDTPAACAQTYDCTQIGGAESRQREPPRLRRAGRHGGDPGQRGVRRWAELSGRRDRGLPGARVRSVHGRQRALRDGRHAL